MAPIYIPFGGGCGPGICPGRPVRKARGPSAPKLAKLALTYDMELQISKGWWEPKMDNGVFFPLGSLSAAEEQGWFPFRIRRRS